MCEKCRALVLVCLTFSLQAQEVQAGLYRPPAPVLDMVYAPAQLDQHTPLTPVLHLRGKGFPDPKGRLEVRILAGSRELRHEGADLALDGTVFELLLPLPDPCKGADRVAWTWTAGGAALNGLAPLRWSRIQGKVDFVDGKLRPMYLCLHPFNFAAGFTVPIKVDGTFDAQVPARSYAVVNVNGAGYAIDSLERWAWDFDLTRDRTETFRVDRTELYGMHAFRMVGGSGTVFVTFRPTALTRFLQHRSAPGAPPKDPSTMAAVAEHLKSDAMALAPALTKADVRVWLDAEPQTPTDLARIVETGPGGINQTVYILQFLPVRPVARGVHHEVKIEVESRDVLGGKLITDFGPGSAGLVLD